MLRIQTKSIQVNIFFRQQCLFFKQFYHYHYFIIIIIDIMWSIISQKKIYDWKILSHISKNKETQVKQFKHNEKKIVGNDPCLKIIAS